MQQHFAQVSDPHLSSLQDARTRDLVNKRALGFLSWKRRRRFEHRTEVLDALRRDLSQFYLDQLLVTGDLTHIGLPQEFRQARSWLEQLGDPNDVAVIPGNHDTYVATDWQQTFALWQAYMASDEGGTGTDSLAATFPSLRIRGDIAFIGLSTACPKPPFMATGTVGREQLDRLPAQLQRCAEQGLFRVIYLHHSPLPGREKWRKRLTNAAQVKKIITDNGAELVLHGHGHRAHQDEVDTRHGNALVVAIPSASSMGLHGGTPAQYNCYSVERCAGGWQVEIRSRGYQPATGEFAENALESMHFSRVY